MFLPNLPQLIKDLEGKFPGWGDDQCSKAVQLAPPQPVQLLDNLRTNCLRNSGSWLFSVQFSDVLHKYVSSEMRQPED